MDMKNIIIIVVILVVIGLLFYMNYQVKSTEDLFNTVSFNHEVKVSQDTHIEADKKVVEKTDTQQIAEFVEVDDGLDIPPDQIDTIIGD